MNIFVLSLLIVLSSCSSLKKVDLKRPLLTVKWAKSFDPEYQTGNFPLSTAGVTIAQGVVYVGTLDGGMYALDSETGREIWSKKEKESLNATPLVEKGVLYYGSESGRLFARDAVTGELKYEVDLGSPIESAPVFYQGRLVIYLRGHQLACIDAGSGKTLWNYRRAVPVTVTLQRTPRPAFFGNKVLVGFADGYFGALSLDEGTLQWEQKIVDSQKFVDVDLNPLILGDNVIAGSPYGELKSLSIANGEIKSQYNVVSLAHPFLKGETLIIGTSEGEIVFLTTQGDIIKRKRVVKKGINNITWWKDHLVVSTFNAKILAIDPLSLEVIESFGLGSVQSAIFSEFAQSETGLGVLSSRNRLYYFGDL